MKIALYIEDGLEQVVLTPESDTEKSILGKLHEGSRDLSVLRGGFFECRGGWVRQSADHNSTMIVLRPAKPKEPEPPDPPLSGVAYDAARERDPTTPPQQTGGPT